VEFRPSGHQRFATILTVSTGRILYGMRGVMYPENGNVLNRSRRGLICLAAILVVAVSTARTEWLSEGSPVCTESGAQHSNCSVPDGSGSVLIAWEGFRSGEIGGDIYAEGRDGRALPVSISTAYRRAKRRSRER
jgi:hypothetical protein